MRAFVASLSLAATLLAVPLLALPAAAQSASALNAEGMRLYRAGRFPEALAKFVEARERNPEHALAHYNAAATLARLRGMNQVCEHNAFARDIFDALARAIALDPRRRARALVDEDFASVRNQVRWRIEVLGQQPRKDAREILVAVEWWGPSPGAYGPTSAISFQRDGAVHGWALVWGDGEMPSRTPFKGRYTVDGDNVTITFDGEGSGTRTEQLQLTDDGVLVDVQTKQRAYSDDSDECSA